MQNVCAERRVCVRGCPTHAFLSKSKNCEHIGNHPQSSRTRYCPCVGEPWDENWIMSPAKPESALFVVVATLSQAFSIRLHSHGVSWSVLSTNIHSLPLHSNVDFLGLAWFGFTAMEWILLVDVNETYLKMIFIFEKIHMGPRYGR